VAGDAAHATGAVDRVSTAVGRYVDHEDAFVSFVSLWVVATAFAVAWLSSYELLSQGLLRAGNPLLRRNTREAFRGSS